MLALIHTLSMFFVLVFSFFPALTPVAKCVQLPQLVSEKARSGRWLSPLGGSCFLTCDKALRRLLSVRSRPARGTISLTVSSQVRGVPGEENREKDADQMHCGLVRSGGRSPLPGLLPTCPPGVRRARGLEPCWGMGRGAGLLNVS